MSCCPPCSGAAHPTASCKPFRQHEDIKVFASDVLLEELADVLTRPGPAERLGLLNVTARQLLADYVEAIDLVTPLATPRTVPDGPDDDTSSRPPLPPVPTSSPPVTASSSASAPIVTFDFCARLTCSPASKARRNDGRGQAIAPLSERADSPDARLVSMSASTSRLPCCAG